MRIIDYLELCKEDCPELIVLICRRLNSEENFFLDFAEKNRIDRRVVLRVFPAKGTILEDLCGKLILESNCNCFWLHYFHPRSKSEQDLKQAFVDALSIELALAGFKPDEDFKLVVASTGKALP